MLVVSKWIVFEGKARRQHEKAYQIMVEDTKGGRAELQYSPSGVLFSSLGCCDITCILGGSYKFTLRTDSGALKLVSVFPTPQANWRVGNPVYLSLEVMSCTELVSRTRPLTHHRGSEQVEGITPNGLMLYRRWWCH